MAYPNSINRPYSARRSERDNFDCSVLIASSSANDSSSIAAAMAVAPA